ncbi:MAG: hypothetical protein KC420_16825, partial [Myxococcales bacterium]|nr:hypothetical protein [Myxococcales bacterium]
MGVIPLMPGGLFDDGEAHEVEAILGDRMVDFSVDEDMVIPGMGRTWIPRFLESKAAAMKPDDPALFRELAEAHGVPFSGLLDGEWVALLYRTPTFAKTPARVALMVGLGMRPKTLKGLPLPAGMKIWKNHKWSIIASEIAAVEKPARTKEVDVAAVIAAADAAQAAVDEVAAGEAWRAMMKREEWGEHDLEVQLYVRIE